MSSRFGRLSDETDMDQHPVDEPLHSKKDSTVQQNQQEPRQLPGHSNTAGEEENVMLTTSVVTNDSSAPAQSGRRNSDETERRQASEMHEEAETEKQPSDGVENHPADSPTMPGPPLFSDVVKQPSLNTTTTPGTGQQGHTHMNARGNRGVGHVFRDETGAT